MIGDFGGYGSLSLIRTKFDLVCFVGEGVIEAVCFFGDAEILERPCRCNLRS